jgi:hypothetical protein
MLKKTVFALALIGLGWAAAKAQSSQGDFALSVEGGSNQITVSCLTGCKVGTPGAPTAAQKSFKFTCNTSQGCQAPGPIAGWLVK